MTEPTQAQLDEWQALADAATPGTWRVESNTALVWGACDLDDQSSYGMGYPVASADLPPTWKKTNPTAEEMFANAAFIATARTALPALIAHTKKLEAAITTLTRKLEGAKARAEKAETENVRLREALEIIAKRRQCLDNLMSNQDVAIAALKGEKSK